MRGMELWTERLMPVSYTHLDVYKRQVKFEARDTQGVSEGVGQRRLPTARRALDDHARQSTFRRSTIVGHRSSLQIRRRSGVNARFERTSRAWSRSPRDPRNTLSFGIVGLQSGLGLDEGHT